MTEKTIDPAVAAKKPAASSPANDTMKDGAAASLINFTLASTVEVKVKVGRGKTAQAKAFGPEPPAPTGFTIDRLVINLQVAGNKNQPIELAVRARGVESKLYYYANNTWYTISGVTKDATGYLNATVPNWPDDPPVAAGH